jgi:molecular chaperone IbpA
MTANSNFAPLFRSSVGFDRVFNLLEKRTRSISDWPPYDIVKTGEDTYRITVAVAGFAQEDLDLTYQSNLLTIIGKKMNPRHRNICIAASRAVPSNIALNVRIMCG